MTQPSVFFESVLQRQIRRLAQGPPGALPVVALFFFLFSSNGPNIIQPHFTLPSTRNALRRAANGRKTRRSGPRCAAHPHSATVRDALFCFFLPHLFQPAPPPPSSSPSVTTAQRKTALRPLQTNPSRRPVNTPTSARARAAPPATAKVGPRVLPARTSAATCRHARRLFARVRSRFSPRVPFSSRCPDAACACRRLL